MGEKYLLTTLGCKVNQYESQLIREVLESHGLHPAGSDDSAVIAIVNTCAVTGQASRKNRQAVRRLSNGGRTPVVVVGCGGAADAPQLKRLPGVLAVWSHDVDVRAELRSLLRDRLGLMPRSAPVTSNNSASSSFLQPGAMRDEVRMMADVPSAGRQGTKSRFDNALHPIPELPIVKGDDALVARIESFAGHQRAFLKIQDGCDAFCTYCIIPQLRPRLRSKPVKTAVAEAADLVRAGHREIILTGIFLGAYGRETALRKRWRGRRSPLAELVAALAEVEGLARLRLSSLEPGDLDESLLEVIGAHDVCVPHFHLPLQSGCENILRRMNRQYTPNEFVKMVDRVHAVLDRPAITTDIIVGFPGETEDDFQASVDLARHAKVSKIHAFPFSPREGTAAAKWRREFIDPVTVRERMQRLGEVERELSLAFRRQFIGQTERVIVESAQPFEAQAFEWNMKDQSHSFASNDVPVICHGRADRYFDIHFESGVHAPGDLVSVRIDRVTPTRTHGALIEQPTGTHPLPVLSAT